jgi:hypothetical protein
LRLLAFALDDDRRVVSSEFLSKNLDDQPSKTFAVF